VFSAAPRERIIPPRIFSWALVGQKEREMDGDQDTAARYRRRAHEVRAIAAQMMDRETTDLLLSIAEDYDRLAVTMEGIAKSDIERADKVNRPPEPVGNG